MPRLVSGQKLEYIKIPELENLLNNHDNRLYVINFWATWCAPCVAELPEFEKVAKDYDSNRVPERALLSWNVIDPEYPLSWRSAECSSPYNDGD